MLKITYSIKAKHDIKRLSRQGQDLGKLLFVIDILIKGQSLPKAYKEHSLRGAFKGIKECHIAPDWLLLYKIYKKDNLLYIVATGSHSYIFG